MFNDFYRCFEQNKLRSDIIYIFSPFLFQTEVLYWLCQTKFGPRTSGVFTVPTRYSSKNLFWISSSDVLRSIMSKSNILKIIQGENVEWGMNKINRKFYQERVKISQGLTLQSILVPISVVNPGTKHILQLALRKNGIQNRAGDIVWCY